LERAAFAAMMGFPPRRIAAMAERSVLSTHVLNAAQGVLAEGVSVELWRLHPAEELVARTATGPDGRAGDPLLPPGAFAPGRYELRFGVGDYFRGRGSAADPPFLDVIPVRVFLADAGGHYHVPLLCTPWSYTTYRGS
jgi:5-hydroxyisourate hydrolase